MFIQQQLGVRHCARLWKIRLVVSCPPPPPHHSLPFNLCKPPCPPGTGRRHHWLTCWQCRGHLPVFISLKGSVTFDTVGYSLPLKILFPLCIQNTPFSWFSQGLSSWKDSLLWSLHSSLIPSQQHSPHLSSALSASQTTHLSLGIPSSLASIATIPENSQARPLYWYNRRSCCPWWTDTLTCPSSSTWATGNWEPFL